MTKKLKSHFLPDSGAKAFFISIIVWGIGIGCFSSSLNNYLSDIHGFNELQRGWLEFFREIPGFLLVFILAALHKTSDWKVLRIGTVISLVGAIALLIPSDKIFLTLFIVIWSTGEHLVMPIRSSIAMQVAHNDKAGRSLGLVTSAMNAGTVAGSIIVALIFWTGIKVFGCQSKVFLFNTVWALIAILMLVSIVCTFTKNAPTKTGKRPRLLFKKKFSKFYILELFYGARKQIFITFAPFLLIIEYGFSTSAIAALMAVCAFVNIFASPWIGKLTDKFGYKNIMIYDTVILFFVCLMYGYAGEIFAFEVAKIVLCVNFLLDMVISTTSMATSIYVRDISKSKEEVTSALSSGISVNHIISILAAPLGGWIWHTWGIGLLFSFAAIMALLNSAFALTLPNPKKLKQS